MIRAMLGIVLLLLAFVGTVSAECASLPLRVFTPEERARFETQYGVNWWQSMGLIPGPATAGDYVDRPFGDSVTTVYSPQQFWDPRGCGSAERAARPGPGKPRPRPTP